MRERDTRVPLPRDSKESEPKIEGLITIGKSLPDLLGATLININLFLALIVLGLLVGVVIALLQVYGNRFAAALASGWEWFFRGVPALVLLFLFFFGTAEFGFRLNVFTAAALALGFRSSGYQSQIFRGAIQAIPPGQMMAAQSIGLSRSQAIAYIILPQALRLAIPAWSNEFSSVIKDTTLAYAVGVNGVLRHARYIMVRHYKLAMLAYITVALIFLALTYAGNWLLGLVERRLALPGFQMKGVQGREAVSR